MQNSIGYDRIYVIDTGANTGEYNMAWDIMCTNWLRGPEAQAQLGRHVALLRFYNWSPPAISLGYNQNPDHLDLEKCKAKGIDVVKRPTGGRAVLHIDEITYSFFSSINATTEAYYKAIHLAIAGGLKKVGVLAGFQKSQPDFRTRYKKTESLACFTASAKEELEVQNRKLVGSAQRRFGNILLQHGSLLLSEKHKEILDLIKEDDSRVLDSISKELESKTISLSEIISRPFCTEELIRHIIDGFQTIFRANIHNLETLEFESLLTEHLASANATKH